MCELIGMGMERVRERATVCELIGMGMERVREREREQLCVS